MPDEVNQARTPAVQLGIVELAAGIYSATTMRRLLLLISLAVLCGCQFFQASIFPGWITLASAQLGVGSEIPPSDAHSFTLSSVTTANGDFVFLATSRAIAGTALFVMDANLHVLQRFTNADLVAIYGGALPDSPRAILGAGGDIVILGLDSLPTPAGLTSPVALGETPAAGSFGYAESPSNIAGFRVSGDLLAYYVYTPWGAGAYRGDFNITGSTLSFNLIGVYADPQRADTVLILEEITSLKDYYLLLTRSDFIAPGLTWPFVNFYPYFVTDHFDRDVIGYSDNSFIALQRSNNAPNRFVRFDMTGTMLPDSLKYDGPTDIQISTRSAGGWCYFYDRAARTVTRMNAWWTR